MRRIITAVTVALAAAAALTAPPAAADSADPVTGAFEDSTSSPLATYERVPKRGCPEDSCTGSTSTAPVPIDADSGELWFWEGPRAFRLPFANGTVEADVATITLSYAELAIAASCPGPLTGAAGSMPVLGVPTPRNIAASFSWAEFGSQDTYSWLDLTDPLVPVMATATFGSSEYRLQFGCKSYTPPAARTTECTKVGQYQLMGPFDQQGSPMRTVEQGGTNTRVVVPPSTYGVDGPIAMGTSALGASILTPPLPTPDGLPVAAAVQTAYIATVSTTAASMDAVHDLCLETDQDLTLGGTRTERLTSYGRYYNDTRIWRDRVVFYVFGSYGTNPTVLSRLWPGVYGVAPQWQLTPGYLPVYIESVTPLTHRDERFFYALHCAKATPSQTVTRESVPSGAEWAGGGWSTVEGTDDQFYTYQCAQGDPGPPTRVSDLLECDRYGTPWQVPYQYQWTPYTYSVGTYQAECWGAECTGSSYIDWGTDWSGTTCPYGGTMHDGHCLGWTQGTTTVSYSYRNPTPVGWTDTGLGWSRKLAPPAGFTDDGTQYVSVSYSDIIVGRKYAAPIASATPNRFSTSGVYDAMMTGDRYRLEWTLPRFNLTSTGQDVTTLPGADIRYRTRFALDDASSPILIFDSRTGTRPIGGKNSELQPYHLFLDTSPDSDDDDPGPFHYWHTRGTAWVGNLPSAVVDDWSPLKDDAWLDRSRTLWLRFFTSSTAGSIGWVLTPWWEVTATVPITSSSPVLTDLTSTGEWILGTTAVQTELRRQTYTCPGQPLRAMVSGTATSIPGEYLDAAMDG